MSNSSNQNALEEREGEEGLRLGYSMEIETCKYDVDEEFRKPGYAHGPEGDSEAHFDRGRGYNVHAKGSVGGIRTVIKDVCFAQVDGPSGNVGSKADKEGAFIGGRGNLGKAEVHAGQYGVGVQGPGSRAEVHVGNKGLKMGAGAHLAAGKVEVGHVELGASVGVRGFLQADKDGVGAIVPGIGGAVVAKDGGELKVGPFSVKIRW